MVAFVWLVVLALRSTVVLAVALALTLPFRRGSSVSRHRLLTLTALGLLALPALPRVLPSWRLPLPVPRVGSAAAPTSARLADPPPASDAKAATEARAPRLLVAARQPGPAPGAGRTTPPFASFLATAVVIAWLAGALAGLAGLVRALLRERRVLASARPLAGAWLETLVEARRSFDMAERVRLLSSEEIDAPVTGGWPRPVLLVPSGAKAWSDERRRLVVQHELVHVVRSDGLRSLAWRLVAAFYWYHPLARLAERRAKLAAEQACDETVVHLGTRPSTYARHLLEIAASLRAPSQGFASALPMLERSQLERRLVMILDGNPAAGRGRSGALVGLSLLAATVVGVATASPFSPIARIETQTAGAPAAKAVGAAPAAPATPAAPPVRGSSSESVCRSGVSGTSIRTYGDRYSDSDRDGLEGDFELDQSLGGERRLCARVHGPVRFDETSGAIRELPKGAWVEIETGDGRSRSQRMRITADEGAPRHEWWVNGAPHAIDDAARAWLKDALEVVSAYRTIGSIEGQVGSLQGEIGSIQGEIGSLQGEIGSIQGEEGSLQGNIGSIQGERGSLEGEIGSHQGAIGGLEAARGSASAALQQQIDHEIREHEAAIRKLEAEKDDGALTRRLSQAEAELRAFQQTSHGQIAELERKIEAIRREDGIGKLERQIQDLHADDRIDEIKRRAAPAVERLRKQVQALGG